MTSEGTAHTPGENLGHEIMRLRRDGLTVKEAAEAVKVSERQAYRLIKNLATDPTRFERWSPSSETSGTPEKIKWLFDTYMAGGWFIDEADIAWALHCAAEDLDTSLIRAFSRLYLAAEDAPIPARTRHRMIIDWALWHRIWESGEAVEEFVETIPVFTNEELYFAAEITSYLKRHEPAIRGQDTSARTPKKIRTVVEGVEDRKPFFDRAINEIAQAADERKRISGMNRRLEIVRVPGESGNKRNRRGGGK